MGETVNGIRYVVGDATRPEGNGPKVIVHVCNNIGAWGAGFVKALSARWPEPERQYRQWMASIPVEVSRLRVLGAWRSVLVEENPRIWVVNLIGQEGIGRSVSGIPPVRYDAIERGLKSIGVHYEGLGISVHMPRIGCGLAGGKWEEIEPIIQRTLVARGIPVTVYDLPEGGAK